VDLEYIVDAFPQPNRKVQSQQQELCAGGPATNAAITFSFLGGAASLITALGRHPLSTIAWNDLEKHGVQVQDVAADMAAPPAVSSICVHDQTGERTIVSANAGAQMASLDRLNPEILSGASILLVDGHHMSLCIEAASAARQSGIKVVMDGGSWKQGMPDLLRYVDIAICSQDFEPPGEENAQQFLRHHGLLKIAITRGEKPILWSTPESSGEFPVRQVQAKDTSGAGDVFHGAFCWAFANGCEFTQALIYASDVATESCLYYGTHSWMRGLQEFSKSFSLP
jgi:sugar/nucleoside kinase (ribokinase family)